MTPKEKANDILDKFWLLDKVKPMITEKQAKQCSLIAVDEIISALDSSLLDADIEWWKQVRKQIEKI
jgi:hypothetical protein